ncbi:TPR repeat-containing protein DDB_G0287407-like [Argopecten irradians]|uniref:TPR repeat-containing protein DDB_G0287407-like n=1 Tax=Argopecten irradians TaxID=31199 RepID=UPI00371178F2
MTNYPKKLKDPSTLRIFFSSPFGGMEEEREELTRRYFPHINHICNSRGVQFVAVDMRWGITTESSASAQVINLCLKELDRSDMIIGFFGQRYGWHGAGDTALQENFDNAVSKYPWLSSVRDKSVTELEFLHGHLNNPGSLPAYLCFRDKAYDDKVCEEARKKGDKKMVFKYSPESDESVKLLDDLKCRCKDTESLTLGVNLCYKNPKEGAQLMFKAIHEHLTKYLMISSVHVVQEDRKALAKSLHAAFLSNKIKLYEGGTNYIKQLIKNVDAEIPSPYLVTGLAGSGKSALICNWLDQLMKNPGYRNCCVVYHFVGCARDSARIQSVLTRVTEELEEKVVEMSEDNSSGEAKKESSNDVRELMRKLSVVLEKLVSLGKQPVVVIDGLGNVKRSSKSEKAVYWLPEFPKQAVLVVSTKNTDEDTITELKSRNFCIIDLPPLDLETQRAICVQTLRMAGKELSPAQVDKVVQAKQTENALFMRIVLNELVSFGYFRLLDQKIDSLVSCQSVHDLFGNVLQRLEEDYNVPEHDGNLVEQVMCSLYLSRQGLAEREITELYNVTWPVWSPFYFAVENYIIDQSGHLYIGLNDLRTAIYNRYLQKPETKSYYLRRIIRYFEDNRKGLGHFSGKKKVNYTASRVAYELPYLLKSLGDLDGLALALLDLQLFLTLIDADGTLYLVELWKETGLQWSDIAKRYIDVLKQTVVNTYIDMEETDSLETDSAGVKILDTVLSIQNFFLQVGDFHAASMIMEYHIRICEKNVASGKLQDESVLMTEKYSLACLYVDHSQFTAAEKLHREVLDYRLKIVDEAGDNVTKEDRWALGTSYHGLHVLYQQLMEYEKALKYLEKSIQLEKTCENDSDLSASYTNMATVKMQLGLLDEALEYALKALKMEEDIHFGHLPPKIGNLFTNIGLIFRRKGDLDKAEQFYFRSLQIKRQSFGDIHIDIPISLMNLGTLEGLRGNPEKSLNYYLEGLSIYKALNVLPGNVQYLMLQENALLAKWKLGRHAETLEDFFPFLDVVEKEQRVDFCLGWFLTDIVKHLISEKRYPEALRITLDLINSKHVSAVNIVHLDLLDIEMTPPDHRPVRPANMTVDYALEKWPESPELVQHKAVNYLIPKGDAQEFVRLLNRLHDCTSHGSAVYDFGLQMLDSNNVDTTILLAVTEAALEKYPDSIAYLRNMVSCRRKDGQHDIALKGAEKLFELAPEDTDIALLAISQAAFAHQFNLGREFAQKAKERFPDDQELLKKVDNLIDLLAEAEREIQSEDK